MVKKLNVFWKKFVPSGLFSLKMSDPSGDIKVNISLFIIIKTATRHWSWNGGGLNTCCKCATVRD